MRIGVGNRVVFQGKFRDRTRVLADPAAVFSRILDKDGALVADLVPARISTGIWESTYLTTAPGVFYVEMWSTGNIATRRKVNFEVEEIVS